MQIFSQNENTSCVDFLQDKSTAVQYYCTILESTFRGITVGLALARAKLLVRVMALKKFVLA